MMSRLLRLSSKISRRALSLKRYLYPLTLLVITLGSLSSVVQDAQAKMKPPCLLTLESTYVKASVIELTVTCKAQIKGQMLQFKIVNTSGITGWEIAPVDDLRLTSIKHGEDYTVRFTLTRLKDARDLHFKDLNLRVQFWTDAQLKVTQLVKVPPPVDHDQDVAQPARHGSSVHRQSSSQTQQSVDHQGDKYYVIPTSSKRKRAVRMYRGKRRSERHHKRRDEERSTRSP